MAYEAQKKAAAVSGRNRSRRAQEKRDREQRRAQYPIEHDRGEHDGIILLGCPKCEAKR